MSMSTPGPERVPSTVKVGKTSGQGKPPAGSKPKASAAKATGAKATGPKGGGAKGRKPITPVKASGGRNWGPIAVGGAVAVLVLAIIGYGIFAVARGSRGWEQKVADIKGVVNYRAQKNPQIDSRQ